jgi:glutaredoxin
MFELQEGYTVLTKEGCKWCTKVKKLLPRARIIPCDEFLKDKKSFFEHVDTLTGKEYRMFPMVFFHNDFVGGYKETKHRVDTELTFDAVYF